MNDLLDHCVLCGYDFFKSPMTGLGAAAALGASFFGFLIGMFLCGRRWWWGVIAVVSYLVMCVSGGLFLTWYLWPVKSGGISY